MKKLEISFASLSCQCQSCLHKTQEEIRAIDSVDTVEINNSSKTIVLTINNMEEGKLLEKIKNKSNKILKEANFCSINELND